MIFRIPSQFRKPVIISIVLHLILLGVLATKLPTTTKVRTQAAGDMPIVHAVAVNQTAVSAEINRIKDQQQQAEQKQQEMQRRQQQAQQEAQQKRAAEQAHLQALRQAETLRLAQLQAEQLRLQKASAEAKASALQLQQLQQAQKEQQKEKQKAQALAKAQQTKKLLAESHHIQQQFMRDQLAQEQQQLAQARLAQMQGILDQYKAQILAAIENQWIVPDNANKDLSCVLLIQLAPNGAVLHVETAKTSGDTVLDQSARDAVFKASPLPVPHDPAVFASFRLLRLTVRPLNVI